MTQKHFLSVTRREETKLPAPLQAGLPGEPLTSGATAAQKRRETRRTSRGEKEKARRST